jgi:peptide chain release factor 2
MRELERQTEQPDLWQDRERAESVLTRLKGLKRRYEPWQKLRADVTDLAELYELAVAEEEADLETEISATAAALQRTCAKLQQLEWMAGPHDAAGCFLTVHAGAGGTEACDWVAMLLRMYTRWAERHEFKVEIIDLMEVEGGVKSVTAEVAGDYAFGFLRAEGGIHRLVRISPFDASKRRHTSFASVAASPVIDDSIEVEIRPEDLRVDTYRASGAGGQHVNKTDSAVRMTHLPTGIVVQCQNERSQHKNRATAMKVLRSRLYDYFEEQQRRERRDLEGDKRDISWGNQIRSYVFQPYTLVKDHRTRFESGNVQAVIDGAIDPFITAYLKHDGGALRGAASQATGAGR